MRSNSAPSLKGRALRLLAARDHSRAELERKLAPYAESAEELRRALDEMQAKGFLDEARTAQSLINRRAPRLGTTRVLGELRQRGLPEALVQDAASELRATEEERARAAWHKKFGQPPADAQERARHMRFLAARGFAPELVRRTVPAPGQAPADDES